MSTDYRVELHQILPTVSPTWLIELDRFVRNNDLEVTQLNQYPEQFVAQIVQRKANGYPDSAAFTAATMLYGRYAIKLGHGEMYVSLNLILGLIASCCVEAECNKILAKVSTGHGDALPVSSFIRLFKIKQIVRE